MTRLDDLQLPPLADSKQFERMLRDLFSAELKDPFVRLHGRSGHRQHGVDIVALPHGAKGPVGIQAKEKNLRLGSRLTITELRAEVRKARSFYPGLKTLILATTAPRDGELQREAIALTLSHRRRKLFDVQLCFWDEVCMLLEKHRGVAANYYPTLFPNGIARSSSERPGRNSRDLVILPNALLRIISLVIVAPGPVALTYFDQFFPDIVEKACLRKLLKMGYLDERDGLVTVPASISRALRKDKSFCEEQLATWERTLMPLQHHVDMAIYLAVLFLQTNRPEKAVETLCDIAEGLEPGSWNFQYLRLLQRLDKPKLLSTLTGMGRIRFPNALGLCTSREGHQQESLESYDRLLREARRLRNSWGIGQALINKGVAYHQLGDNESSKVCYQRAVGHARRSTDYVLLGRALHNLAQLSIDEDIELAQRYLTESAAAN